MPQALPIGILQHVVGPTGQHDAHSMLPKQDEAVHYRQQESEQDSRWFVVEQGAWSG